MTVSSYPYESSPMTEALWDGLAGLFAPSGLCLSYPGGAGKAAATGGLTFTIDPYLANVRGTRVESDAVTNLNAVTGDPGGNRIDRYVLRRNLVLNTAGIFRIAGTPASTPTVPDITRDSDIYDVLLCRVRVNQNATSITYIYDEREICSGLDGDTGAFVLLGHASLSAPATQLSLANLATAGFEGFLIQASFKSDTTLPGGAKALLQFDTNSPTSGLSELVYNGGATTSSSSSAAGVQIAGDAISASTQLNMNVRVLSSTPGGNNNYLVGGHSHRGTSPRTWTFSSSVTWNNGNLKLHLSDGSSLSSLSTLSVYGIR